MIPAASAPRRACWCWSDGVRHPLDLDPKGRSAATRLIVVRRKYDPEQTCFSLLGLRVKLFQTDEQSHGRFAADLGVNSQLPNAQLPKGVSSTRFLWELRRWQLGIDDFQGLGCRDAFRVRMGQTHTCECA